MPRHGLDRRSVVLRSAVLPTGRKDSRLVAECFPQSELHQASAPPGAPAPCSRCRPAWRCPGVRHPKRGPLARPTAPPACGQRRGSAARHPPATDCRCRPRRPRPVVWRPAWRTLNRPHLPRSRRGAGLLWPRCRARPGRSRWPLWPRRWRTTPPPWPVAAGVDHLHEVVAEAPFRQIEQHGRAIGATVELAQRRLQRLAAHGDPAPRRRGSAPTRHCGPGLPKS